MFTLELTKEELAHLYDLLDLKLKTDGISSLQHCVNLFNLLSSVKTRGNSEQSEVKADIEEPQESVDA